MVDLLWAVPGLPLAGAFVMLLAGRWLSNTAAALICTGAVLAAFVVSLLSIADGARETTLFAWLPLVDADFALKLDALSSLMILIVTGIGLLIHIYSIGYMAHERGNYRFFGYLNLFVFFMLLLVLANNFALLFAGWEGVGLCSYLLIGYAIDRPAAGAAGMKAFLVNRVGDAAFILGMLILVQVTGSLRYSSLPDAAQSESAGLIALLLFLGAMGKSAQFPLHIWLPDAMEGPTPVSALIHAATMVTAGVYLVARSHVLFSAAPDVMLLIAIVGAFTAIFAASVALVQNDIKRVLAYSTVSQLGFMFMALGVGAYWVAVFHLFTHAFFKALLFLGAGSVIHGAAGEQDLRKLGGLRRKMPFTHATMLVGTLAIAGVPGLAGFFSKDEILLQSYVSPLGSLALCAVGLITALMTAYYMWRLLRMTFYGVAADGMHAHESPLSMTAPLFVLAAGSLVVGWPRASFEHFLSPSVLPANLVEHPTASISYGLMGLASLAAVAGILLARFSISGRLAGVLEQAWFVDSAIRAVFVTGLARGGGRFLWAFDRLIVDGGVNGAGLLARLTSRMLMFWDRWVIDGFVRFVSAVFYVGGYPFRLLQTGVVQNYALFFVLGVLAMFGAYLTTK